MNDEEIRNAVKKINFRYASSLPPKLVNRVDIKFPQVRLSSPDRFSQDDFIPIDNYFYRMNAYWDKEAEVSFYLRQDNPIVMIDSIFVANRCNRAGVKKTLLSLTEEVAESLGCENRVYALVLGDEGFWRSWDYSPINFAGNKVYWSKTKLSD